MIEINRSLFGHSISVAAIPAGLDWNIAVTGGCSPHVGSVSLAEHINGTVQLRTLSRNTHMDHFIGDYFAKELSTRLRCTVCVSCGIHFDNLTKDDINEIILISNSLLSDLCEIL